MTTDPCWIYFAAEEQGQSTTSQHCPERPYVSLRIGYRETAPTAADEKLVVRRITLTTVSHDHGFSNSADQHGAHIPRVLDLV